jgi:protoporphyrinogen oxidase
MHTATRKNATAGEPSAERPEGAALPTVVVLGGGPAGVGAAYQLRRLDRARVILVEQQPVVGGNAGSFESGGQRLDYGSHRLHSASDPEILADIRSLLGDDLLDRPRNGRIRLRGRWLRFPLRPLDLLLRLDPGFAAGAARDMALGKLRRAGGAAESFATVLRETLGPTICEHFYFPYARKIGGRDPGELSAIQARKRVSANSFGKLLRRLARPPGAGRFWYPRRGYGQISEAYAAAAEAAGAELCLGSRVVGLHAPGEGSPRWAVEVEREGQTRRLEADYVWSTIPIPTVARMIRPAAPEGVLAAAAEIEYRAMILVYLELDVDRFTPTDAHYFPEENVVFTRVSEPKNYSDLAEPRGRTTLCAEVPCSVDGELWGMDDRQLGERVAADLAKVGLPLPRPPVRAFTRRLRQAYPIYTRGYERPLTTLDDWAATLPNFLVYGRQGLFAHDNTHHALYMAYAAVDCLREGRFDEERWSEYREVFKTHVVED